jgi:hypothetical protein
MEQRDGALTSASDGLNVLGLLELSRAPLGENRLTKSGVLVLHVRITCLAGDNGNSLVSFEGRLFDTLGAAGRRVVLLKEETATVVNEGKRLGTKEDLHGAGALGSSRGSVKGAVTRRVRVNRSRERIVILELDIRHG